MGGSCCEFKADRSCGLDAAESAVWPKENTASSKTTDRSKMCDFMGDLSWYMGLLGAMNGMIVSERGDYISNRKRVVSILPRIYE
jgi:hypothetical protein